MGVLTTFLAEEKNPATMSEGALESSGGHMNFPQKKLHLRKLGAIANWRTKLVGHYVLDAADFGRGMSRRPPNEKMASMAPHLPYTQWH